MFWTGSKAAIEAAEAQALAAELAEHPTVLRGGEAIPNPTTAWAIPMETDQPGVWAIPARSGMTLPEGCAETDAVSWPVSGAL